MKQSLLNYLKSLPENNQNILEKSGFYNQTRLMRKIGNLPIDYSHKTQSDKEILEDKCK